MANIILHIGRQKTGTTSIQRLLALIPELLADDDIRYATTGRDNGVAHHALATALNPRETDGSQLTALQTALAAEIAGSSARTLVFSSEAFQRIADFDRLRQFFSGHRLQVIGYLRECFAAKQSSYAQRIHATLFHQDFLSYALQVRHDYAGFTQAWQNVSNHTQFALFERNRLLDGDVVADFLQRLGAHRTLLALPNLQRQDGLPSLGGNLLWFKRLLNQTYEEQRILLRADHFDTLSELAALDKRWRSRWSVPGKARRRIARVDKADRAYLRKQFGKLQSESVDGWPEMPERTTLAADLDVFTSTAAFAADLSSTKLNTALWRNIDWQLRQ